MSTERESVMDGRRKFERDRKWLNRNKWKHACPFWRELLLLTQPTDDKDRSKVSKREYEQRQKAENSVQNITEIHKLGILLGCSIYSTAYYQTSEQKLTNEHLITIIMNYYHNFCYRKLVQETTGRRYGRFPYSSLRGYNCPVFMWGLYVGAVRLLWWLVHALATARLIPKMRVTTCLSAQ